MRVSANPVLGLCSQCTQPWWPIKTVERCYQQVTYNLSYGLAHYNNILNVPNESLSTIDLIYTEKKELQQETAQSAAKAQTHACYLYCNTVWLALYERTFWMILRSINSNIHDVMEIKMQIPCTLVHHIQPFNCSNTTWEYVLTNVSALQFLGI